MGKKTKKKENNLATVAGMSNAAKIVAVGLIIIGVVGSIILVNYVLGTNRADESQASAPVTVSPNGSDKDNSNKKDKDKKDKNKENDKNKNHDESSDNKDGQGGIEIADNNNSVGKIDGGTIAEDVPGNAPGAVVPGPASSTTGASDESPADFDNLGSQDAGDANNSTDGQSSTADDHNNGTPTGGATVENNQPANDTTDDTTNATDDTTNDAPDTSSNDSGSGDANNSVAEDNSAVNDQPDTENNTDQAVGLPTGEQPTTGDGKEGSNNNTNDIKEISELVPQEDADIQVVKQVDKLQAGPGDDVVFTTLITNHGPGSARDVIVHAAVPAGTDYRAYSSTKGVYGAESGVWQIGDLAAGEKVKLAVTANMAGAPIGTTIVDKAIVTTSKTIAAQGDPDAKNNADSQQVVVTNTTNTPHVKQSVKNIGDNEQEWTFILSNPNNDVPIKSLFFNGIPNNTFYIANSLRCVTGGVSIEEFCAYDGDKAQITWNGTLAPDVSGRNVGTADNAVTITYKTELTKTDRAIANTVCINWDYNNNASIKDELSEQQNPNCLTPLIYNGDISGKRDLLVGSLYGLGIGLFIAWLLYLLKKKPIKSGGAKRRSPKKRLRKKTA